MKNIKSIAASFCLAVATLGLTAHMTLAAPITIPTGLNPGDQYRLAFVTSGTRTSTSSNIADYNDFVNTFVTANAELNALGTTWSAIVSSGSTGGVDARDNTGTNQTIDPVGVAIYTVNDTIVATSYADLWDGSIANAISFTENGTAIGEAELVWTGTTTAGIGDGGNTVGNGTVRNGSPNLTSFQWIRGNSTSSSFGQRHVYALSGILSVAETIQISEPAPLSLLALTLLGLAVSRLKRSA